MKVSSSADRNFKNRSAFGLLIAALLFINVFGFFYVRNWMEVRQDFVEKFEELQTEIGFVGLIHNFKNAVLRPDQPEYLIRTKENVARAIPVISWLELNSIALDLSDSGFALTATRDLVNQYTLHLDTVEQGHLSGMSITEIDRQVKVNDEPAEQEIENFRSAVFSKTDQAITRAAIFSNALSFLCVLSVISFIFWADNKRIKLLRDRVKILEQNAELKRFAVSAAHDLRKPLAQVVTASDLLLDEEMAIQADAREYLVKIQDITEDMLHQVSSLLEHTRSDQKPLEKTKFKMSQLVHEVAQNTLDHYGHQHTITMGDIPSTPADRQLMQRVWSNLLSNAIKYTAPGSSAEVHVSGERLQDKVLYLIEDRGIGIQPENSEIIFEPMRRLHQNADDYEGYGLGLATVRSIIKRHGGTVYLDTSYTEGARFCVELPGY